MFCLSLCQLTLLVRSERTHTVGTLGWTTKTSATFGVRRRELLPLSEIYNSCRYVGLENEEDYLLGHFDLRKAKEEFCIFFCLNICSHFWWLWAPYLNSKRLKLIKAESGQKSKPPEPTSTNIFWQSARKSCLDTQKTLGGEISLPPKIEWCHKLIGAFNIYSQCLIDLKIELWKENLWCWVFLII